MRNAARITARALLLPLVAAAAIACGDDGTGPEAGETQMVVKDDPNSAQASAVRAQLLRAVEADPSLVEGGRAAVERVRSAGTTPASASAATFEGVIVADANGSVSSDGETWVEIGSPTSTTLELQSSGETTVHSSATIQGGSYTHVRLVLRNATATIRAGSVVGGLTLNADVDLRLGGPDSEVVIEKQVSTFEVSSDTRTTVVWEMNSEEWANEENTEEEEVEDQEVQQSSDAETRTESTNRQASIVSSIGITAG